MNFGNYQANLGTPPPYPPPLIMFEIPVVGNPNSLGTLAMPGTKALDTVGLVEYYTADGITWTALNSGGSSSTGGFAGVGSPEGVVTASPGAPYIDTSSGSFWIKKTGTGNTGWLQLIA